MATPDPQDANRCRPCRGTGKIISGKGGSPHEIECPWCGGTGIRPAAPAPASEE